MLQGVSLCAQKNGYVHAFASEAIFLYMKKIKQACTAKIHFIQCAVCMKAVFLIAR